MKKIAKILLNKTKRAVAPALNLFILIF